jgi:2-dehydropantoate 2-reductase
MKIGIYGTGGVGGYFGARLAQNGNEVRFIARGQHLKAIQEKGLLMISPKGNFRIFPCQVSSMFPKGETYDLIFIAVKSWQLPRAAHDIAKIVTPNTLVISLLNGVRNEELLKQIVPAKNILGGLCKVVSKIEAPGVITHLSYEPTIVFGELDHRITPRAEQVETCLRSAGIKTRLSDNIQIDQWAKFMFITTISGLGALTRATIGEMLAQPSIRDMMKEVATEIETVGKALNVIHSNSVIERQFEIIEQQPYSTTSSMQRDIMAGRPSELMELTGAIVELGEQAGVRTPLNKLILELLLPQENKARTV